MIPARTFPGLRRHVQRFARDRDGLSAVEFAMVLPVMLTLYLGSVQLGDGLAIKFRTALAARTVADLASQYVSIDGSTMSSILGAASIVVAPYPAANMIVTVSEITIDANGHATITWSDSLNGTPHTVGQSVTLPTTMQIPNTSLIWGEVTYPYTPQLGYVLTGTVNMYQSTYFYPRMSNSVACNGC
jgi:Flp pilus assembly protein TadG